MPHPNDTAATFELTRLFQAPLARVWAAWSESDAFARWWGPGGSAVTVLRFDFHPGGHCHYAMDMAGAPTLWGRFSYREITPGARIAWLNSFATDRGALARAPFSERCPFEIENTVTFTAQHDTTVVHLAATPFGASDDELAFFADLCTSGSLAHGYGGTFDQLAAHLAA